MIAIILKWLAAKKAGLVLYGAAAAVGAALVLGLIQYGRGIAAARCDAAAKQARIEALQIDLEIADLRATHAERAIAGLLRQRATNDAAIAELQAEVADARLQSTAPGAKPDENALLDDRCNYTARGARRVRE